MSLLHATHVRENVLLHARSYRLTVYSSEKGHRRLTIKGIAEQRDYCMLQAYVRTCCYTLEVVALLFIVPRIAIVV